jgi:peptide-methionine (S)-S-oxide reductase
MFPCARSSATLLLFLFTAIIHPVRADSATAVFAGGCFWCMEAAYQEAAGVKDVVSGFTGGTLKNPTYRGNHEGHFEAIEVTYDPAVISYQDLLDLYWVNIDPFDNRGQFCDKGFSYRSAIFAADATQRKLAEASLQAVKQQFPQQTVYTELRNAGDFWPVEEYHQDYYLKNPIRYQYYRWNCGRDQRLQQIWGEAAGGH